MKVGLWCLAGLLGFLLLEKGFAEQNKEEDTPESKAKEEEQKAELLVWKFSCLL